MILLFCLVWGILFDRVGNGAKEKRPGPLRPRADILRGTTWIRALRRALSGRFRALSRYRGTSAGAYRGTPFSPVLRDDFPGGLGRTSTSRPLSLPPPSGYSFPSSQFTVLQDLV